MDNEALGTYLNDHLGGATLGSDHARQLEEMHKDGPYEADMARVAGEIEEDLEILQKMMERLGVDESVVKKAGAWVAEKAGRVKFQGISSGDGELGRYLALETMSLGVEGKRSLWTALERIRETVPEIGEFDIDGLIARAESQRATLEELRLSAAPIALSPEIEVKS
jgi:hypothetical protein